MVPELSLRLLRACLRHLRCLVLPLLLATPAFGADRYALIISGANGDESYAQQYAAWRQSLSDTLQQKLGFDPAYITVLFDGGDGAGAATASGVRQALEALRRRVTSADLVFVFLIGHGTFDGADAKFNLVGPDLESAEWAALLRPIAGRVILVDSTGASSPFIERLAGPRRIVITATESPAQRFDTVFPEYFIRALGDPAADIDKNGRVSILEAFIAASVGVRRSYEQRGQLATERALIDDNGDGQGKEAEGEGTDGAIASRTYLDDDRPGAAPTDDELLALLQKKASLEADIDDLKQRRPLMTRDDYDKEFEKLMVDLAKVSREIRLRKKT
jgi:hypothetical protein